MYDYPPKNSPGRNFDGPNDIRYLYPVVDPRAPPVTEELSAMVARLRVPFVTPDSSPITTIPNDRAKDWLVETNSVFDIFFYMPVTVLGDPDAWCRDVVIMFNGLDEIMPWQSWLYDSLGHSLAENGIAAVLLPSPFHLNRTLQLRNPTSSQPHENLRIPSHSRNAYAPYVNFYQSFLEVDQLRELMHSSKESKGKKSKGDEWGLYGNFRKDTRISLFGFSMGGMRAITKFLIDDDDVFHKCILLSSGATLRKLTAPEIDRQDWHSYVGQITKVETKNLLAHGIRRKDLDRHWTGLLGAFTADDFGALHLALEKRGERIQVIVGSKDREVGLDVFNRLSDLANVQVIPGMSHLTADTAAFTLHYGEIVDHLVRFLRMSTDQPRSKSQVRDQVIRILLAKGADIRTLTVEDLLQRAARDRQLRASLLLSTSCFRSYEALIDSMQREMKRR